MERREQFAAGDYKSGKYRPLLDSLLQYKDETTGQGLSDEDIRAEVDTLCLRCAVAILNDTKACIVFNK